MVNKVILVGRLGRDPESKYTSGGTAVCNFSIATDETFKDKSGERQKKTEWHKIVVWGKLAEICQQYLKKGSLVYLEGKLQTREWEKDGEKKHTTEVVADTMKMIGSKDGASKNGAAGRPQQADDAEHSQVGDDDIPF